MDAPVTHCGSPAIFTHTAPLRKEITMSTVITGASGDLGAATIEESR
jgi:hypothetical protein